MIDIFDEYDDIEFDAPAIPMEHMDTTQIDFEEEKVEEVTKKPNKQPKPVQNNTNNEPVESDTNSDTDNEEESPVPPHVKKERPKGKVRQGFNPERSYNSYTVAEWEIKEQWYQDKLQDITLSDNPTLQEFRERTSKMDYISTVANIDYAFTKRKSEEYKSIIESEKSRERDFVKNYLINSGRNKPTLDDIEAFIINNINNTEWENTGYSLFELAIMNNDRATFMDSVIKVLNSKKDFSISTATVLKIEYNITNMTESVPQT